MRDNCRGIEWLRGQGSNPELLLQRQAWYQFHHLARVDRSVWTERFELPTSDFRSRRAPVAPRPGVVRTDGGSRTRTDGGLSAVPLPIGLRQRGVSRWVDRAGCLTNPESTRHIGEAVRRPTGAWTPPVHALLHHREQVGFARLWLARIELPIDAEPALHYGARSR